LPTAGTFNGSRRLHLWPVVAWQRTGRGLIIKWFQPRFTGDASEETLLMANLHPMLRPYRPSADDPFDRVKAAHLLSRAGFGGTEAEIEKVLQLGPTGRDRLAL
jgi:hypothetical protein